MDCCVYLQKWVKNDIRRILSCGMTKHISMLRVWEFWQRYTQIIWLHQISAKCIVQLQRKQWTCYCEVNSVTDVTNKSLSQISMINVSSWCSNMVARSKYAWIIHTEFHAMVVQGDVLDCHWYFMYRMCITWFISSIHIVSC